jgi:desumoylating isopeptidase 1
MDVQLYVYDLTQGLARQLSQQFLGTHIDAVYHTSIVLDGIEYFFGQGIQSCAAGSTHHGRPMEVVPMGRTELPIELVVEYIDSLRSVYTPESYDLFLHNCNNFSNDFAMFLVGKNIPDHITSLPQTVLNTPFGQMLKPHLDRAMRPITQAPVAPQPAQTAPPDKPIGAVRNIHSLSELEQALAAASTSCAAIFFTSSTCAPCKILYPTYDALAAEAGPAATLIKVDINAAPAIASAYKVRATPTIMTFLHGQKDEEWAGADVTRLRTTVERLVRMAHPPHPHTKLQTAALVDAARGPVRYAKVPPLDKLVGVLGPAGQDPAVAAARKFISGLNAGVKQGSCLKILKPAVSNSRGQTTRSRTSPR